MNINLQHHNLLGNQISPKSEDFCIWWPFYTLVTMAMADILNLFTPPKAATYYSGYSYKVDHTKFRPKSEDFCIWWPFYTLVTMATADILNLFTPPPPQRLPHTTVDIPTKWIIIWLPKHGYQFPTSKSTWKPNFSQIGGFLYFGGHFVPWLPWQRPPF